ncbi:hypothetical protein ACFQLX_24355 [Streptomyces polyrhachis]|uniref:Uncharacterized protein n=1 Tax=Streptomyces polyrhachis TaxID=1282885 RepID=A0ABW2GKY3_9ACTN
MVEPSTHSTSPPPPPAAEPHTGNLPIALLDEAKATDRPPGVSDLEHLDQWT